MSEAATPLLHALPDEIFIWEILIRLPHKPLLCCRAVSRAWRRATSARDFLLAHHGRQPSLPLLYERISTADGGGYLDIIPLDHRAGVAAAAADRLRPVARLGTGGAFTQMEASCDGLIILCTKVTCGSRMSPAYYSVCNPATRQYAPLPQLRGFGIAGMYPHLPTGEYRLLLYPDDYLGDDGPDPGDEWYVYALGSREPPRDIGCLEADAEEDAIQTARPVLFRGGLHWFIEKDDDSESSMILVFDTAAELFRRMRAPAVLDVGDLFEMDGMLGMASFNDGEVTPIDIWMTQDYDAEVWGYGPSNTGLSCRLQTLPCGSDLAIPPSWWFRRGMTRACSLFLSNLPSGYFRLAWMASWSPVSIANHSVLLNFVSNKLLCRIASFRQ